jgi:hypothetical protein
MASSAFVARMLVAFALGGSAGAPALLRSQTAPPAPPRCDTPEFRQFDFWVGDWNVTSGAQPVGTNLVPLEEDGCVVHEHCAGALGGTGQSFNYYDRVDRQWHQTWVSNSGNVLDLAGTLTGGALTLLGERRQLDGSVLRHRLRFRANPDGTVRQLWETSADAGATWSVSFDGLYRKKHR